MLQYICDWCKRTKQVEDAWILGFAAENIGVVSARREITVASAWTDTQAVHPLAVHFCSEDHKDRYVSALFDTEPAEAETVVETTLATGRPARTTRKVVRMVAPVKTTKRTVVKRKRKRA
jgi:hypothetical protein